MLRRCVVKKVDRLFTSVLIVRALVSECPCDLCRGVEVYRGTSHIRNIPLLGLYSRTIPRVLWWSQGGWLFLMGKVPCDGRLKFRPASCLDVPKSVCKGTPPPVKDFGPLKIRQQPAMEF